MSTRAKRRPIRAKLRFEVLKRDGFACRYCGRRAPEVSLQVDHVHPVALGGVNDHLNLAASCAACNNGKGAVPLTETTSAELGVLTPMEEYAISRARDAWAEEVPLWPSLNATDDMVLVGHVQRYGVDHVISAIEYLAKLYARSSGCTAFPGDLASRIFFEIGSVAAYFRSHNRTRRPSVRELYEIRATARMRLPDFDTAAANRLLESACRNCVDPGMLMAISRTTSRWDDWRGCIEQLTFDNGGGSMPVSP